MSSVRRFKIWDLFPRAVKDGTLADIEALLPSTPDQRAAYLNGIIEYNEVTCIYEPIFFRAIQWNNNISVWDLFLNAGVDINSRDSDGQPALYHACMFGNFQAVKYLVEHGANINENHNKCTAIQCAALYNFSDLVAYLARHGATMTSGKPEMMKIYNKNRGAEDFKGAAGSLFFEKKKVPFAVGRNIIGNFLDKTAMYGVVPVNSKTSYAAENERKKIVHKKVEQKLDSNQKEEKQPLLESKDSVNEFIDPNIENLCNHIRANLSVGFRQLDESALLTPILKCELAVLQKTLKKLTKEEQQKLFIYAIRAPEATIIVEQLIHAGMGCGFKNKDILFEAMKADAKLHARKQKMRQFFPNEKTMLLLQKGFTVDQSHLMYAAENIRDTTMVALILKQPSITVEMISECLEMIKKISLQNKTPELLSILTTQLRYEPIIDVLQKGLLEREEQNKISIRKSCSLP